MSTVDPTREGSTLLSARPAWEHPANSFQCKVRLCPEEDGGFSAFALDLPGAVSQGETEQEALANIREACTGVLQTYMARDGRIPWGLIEVDKCAGSKEFWVVVNG